MNHMVSGFAERHRQVLLTIGLFVGFFLSAVWLLETVANWILAILQAPR
jgi:hypothetical protein